VPAKFDSDGNLIDERTRKNWQVDPADATGGAGRKDRTDRRTLDIGGTTHLGAPGSTSAGRHDRPTVPAREHNRGQPDPDAGRTRIYRPNQPDPPEGASPNVDRAAGDPMDDPPVGWLVIVRGPGRGRVATLGMGVNSIGRGEDERVSLDYGDELVSRKNHGTITYDPRGRRFYVQHGGGTNLTYVDNEPVLSPRELEPLARVQMGSTVLRFVPLCGTGFSWDDELAEE
jgi:hypothetical protein